MTKIKRQSIAGFKYLCCILFLIQTLNCIGQVVADPATGQMDIINDSGISLNANFIAPAEIITLNIPVYNLHQLASVPAGTCTLVIDLGNNMIADPTFNLLTAPLSEYFSWTYTVTGMQAQITGNLVAALPGDFAGIAAFKLKAATQGTSLIAADFLVTNQIPNPVLSDEDPNNNSATLGYTVTTQTVPVTFKKVALTKTGCDVQVIFSTEKAINVNRYEIELSTNGINYEKIGQLAHTGIILYTFNFSTENIKAHQIFVRVKSVDQDGKFQYSEIRNIPEPCNETGRNVSMFPNPVHDQKQCIIKTDQGVFKGKYLVSLIDMSGKLLNTTTMILDNIKQFYYNTGGLAAGHYFIKIWGHHTSNDKVIRFQKL